MHIECEQVLLTHVPVICHGCNLWKCTTRAEKCFQTWKRNKNLIIQFKTEHLTFSFKKIRQTIWHQKLYSSWTFLKKLQYLLSTYIQNNNFRQKEVALDLTIDLVTNHSESDYSCEKYPTQLCYALPTFLCATFLCLWCESC